MHIILLARDALLLISLFSFLHLHLVRKSSPLSCPQGAQDRRTIVANNALLLLAKHTVQGHRRTEETLVPLLGVQVLDLRKGNHSSRSSCSTRPRTTAVRRSGKQSHLPRPAGENLAFSLWSRKKERELRSSEEQHETAQSEHKKPGHSTTEDTGPPWEPLWAVETDTDG